MTLVLEMGRRVKVGGHGGGVGVNERTDFQKRGRGQGGTKSPPPWVSCSWAVTGGSLSIALDPEGQHA